jgi:L-fuculose-phosphate aldolase
VNESAARRDLVRYSGDMHRAGFVANHDGNLSARVSADRIICTPTAMSKADIRPDDLVVCDGGGSKIAGARRPFSELNLHVEIYRRRPTAGAVVHAHPPHATAFGSAGATIPHPFLPEAVVSLGAEIPTVPLTAPGSAAVQALSAVVRRCDAVVVAGNGVFAWGPDLETAWLRLELVEHLARIAWTAAPLGGVRPLDAAIVDPLLKKRRAGGLAAPEEGAAATPIADRAAARAQAAVPGADPAAVARIAAEVAARLAR